MSAASLKSLCAKKNAPNMPPGAFLVRLIVKQRLFPASGFARIASTYPG